MSEPGIAECRVALLSNVNMNFVIRMLQKEVAVYEAEGYGNELGILMNPASSYHAFAPEYTFLVMDLMELLEHDLEPEGAKQRIETWFSTLEAAIPQTGIFYISDAYLWGTELSVVFAPGRKAELEMLWLEALKAFCARHNNVRILPYGRMIAELGESNAFSMKMWYMGKILLSNQAQKNLCDMLVERLKREKCTPKKVLLLDLDNTLWGGLAGEAEHSPIVLSEDHAGLAYKNLQRVILQMQKQGVILGIVSKNNEADALDILNNHPHMVLGTECFAVCKINWNPKHENIREIAAELNLGMDSFVFWDDNPTERQLVKEMLPEVTVPEFPERPEELAPTMVAVYREYFVRNVLTSEDLEKTEQYAANAQRSKLAEHAGSFADYLKQLEIVMRRVSPGEHAERFTQLLNKTNQFNLTTRRYDQNQVQQLLTDANKKIYLYNVADRFGDNGIVAAVIVDVAGEVPVIEEFVMSCRIMGKNIEYAVVEDVEQELRKAGFVSLRGIYLPTVKNKPVEKLYEQLGYRKVGELSDGGSEYEIALENVPEREYYVKLERVE